MSDDFKSMKEEMGPIHLFFRTPSRVGLPVLVLLLSITFPQVGFSRASAHTWCQECSSSVFISETCTSLCTSFIKLSRATAAPGRPTSIKTLIQALYYPKMQTPMKMNFPGSQCTSFRKPSHTRDFPFLLNFLGLILLTPPNLPLPLLSLTALLLFWTYAVVLDISFSPDSWETPHLPPLCSQYLIHNQNAKQMTAWDVLLLPFCTLPHTPDRGFSQEPFTSSE